MYTYKVYIDIKQLKKTIQGWNLNNDVIKGTYFLFIFYSFLFID